MSERPRERREQPHGAGRHPAQAGREANGRGEHARESHAHRSSTPARDKKKPWYRRPAIVGAGIVVVIALVVGGALLWRHSREYESTDDAYIDVIAERVSAQIPGRVVRVAVNENQDVAAGDLLVELDPADPRNRLEETRASAAQADAQVAEAEAQRTAVEAQKEQARASEAVAQANATNAANDLRRFKELRAANIGAVSNQQMDRAVAQADSAAAQLHAAQKAVGAADAQAVHAAKQIDAARAAVRSATSQVAQAELTLSYAQVRASLAGRIARKTVTEGNYVQPGAELMAVVPREVYVTANFKETQLTRMRRGQRVEIQVDSYPDLKITGRVDGVQPATGQAFDVLPAENASGNWVKVVQRVPVKIVLDQLPGDPDQRLGSGMSVTATVTVR